MTHRIFRGAEARLRQTETTDDTDFTDGHGEKADASSSVVVHLRFSCSSHSFHCRN